MLENDYYIMNELRKQSMKTGQQKKTGFFEAGRNKHKLPAPSMAQNQVEDYDNYARNSKVFEFAKTLMMLVLFFGFITILMFVL